ncbi:hypothetical protein [Kibdelosporangium philippinense]|uniref:hypothetical protein n=1 Tax=Kibdelosporangium philippinense TaxID=211113 RepID=UPI00360921E1
MANSPHHRSGRPHQRSGCPWLAKCGIGEGLEELLLPRRAAAIKCRRRLRSGALLKRGEIAAAVQWRTAPAPRDARADTNTDILSFRHGEIRHVTSRVREREMPCPAV